MSRVTKIEPISIVALPIQKTSIKKVAAYARVSTYNDEQLNSLEAQKDYYEKKIEEDPSWVLVGIYVDAGYDETLVKQGSKALAKEIQTEHLSLFYMLVGAEKYLAFAMKRRDYKYITSALNVAKSMLTIKVSDLDKDPVLLNTPRATYNLEKGIAGEQPHDPFDLITKITECSPGDEGMDIWLEALDTFFCGDTELIEYVQKVIGLAAIGKVYEEFIIIAYGDGANGKSTFWNT